MRQGQVEDGYSLIRSSWAQTHEALAQAQIACMLAEAEAWLARARILSPTCPLLHISQRRVSGEHPAVQVANPRA